MWSQNRRRTFIRKLSIDRFCGLGADSKSFLSAMFYIDYLIVFFFFFCRTREILTIQRLTGELSKGLKTKNAAEIVLKDLNMPFLSLGTYFVCKSKRQIVDSI